MSDGAKLGRKRRLAAVWKSVDALDLPDLDAMAAEHRAIEEERAAFACRRWMPMSPKQ